MNLTNIHQIEASSVCDLKCKYCIHPIMKRKKQLMDQDTFTQAMSWVLYLRSMRGGHQQEVALTGVGEPFLNPLLPDMIAYVREACPETDITISTNGLKITKKLVDKIAPFKPRVFVSLHDPEKANKAIKLLSARGIYAASNDSAQTGASFNWAGQVKWPVRAHGVACWYMLHGNGVILSDGSIVRCCMDGEGLGEIAHVKDAPNDSIKMDAFKLCNACHMTVVEEPGSG